MRRLEFKQLYLPDTNILITRFLMPDGVGEVQDFMPLGDGVAVHRHRMIRRVLAVRGQMGFVVDVAPRFDYARARHEVALTSHGALFRSPGLTLSLPTRCPLEIVNGGDVRARIAVRAGETATVVLDRVEPGEQPVPYADADITAAFDATVAFWRGWLRRSRYSGRWREMVHRSALTLKLLTYAPTGAIVAAPTTSLPEQLGGVRNWDYRYTWMRDAAFTLYALLRLGFTEEAGAFMNWLQGRFRHAATASRARCRSCTASTGARTYLRKSSRTSRATWARRRCGSATGRRHSCSSTSMASSWIRTISATSSVCRSTTTAGWSSPATSSG